MIFAASRVEPEPQKGSSTRSLGSVERLESVGIRAGRRCYPPLPTQASRPMPLLSGVLEAVMNVA